MAAASRDLDELAREVLDHASEGYQLIDPDYRYLYVNDAALRQLRTKREALIGRTLSVAHPGVEQGPAFAVLRKAMTQRIAQRLEHEQVFPEGDRRWFDVRFQPVPQGLLIISVDITERARTERELARVQRVLAVISGVSQALARASDETSFMQAVCALVVQHGGYRLAWVGGKQDDAARSVRPLAAAGTSDGYLEQLHVTWSDAPRGCGPTGRAIREERAATARYLSSEPLYDPWRKEALARGYASSIALPIRVEGAVVGALSIYAGEPDAFDDHETGLLTELALNLGYGLQALRAQQRATQYAARVQTLRDRLERLSHVARALHTARDRRALIDLVRHSARELLDADGATFVALQGELCEHEDDEAHAPLDRRRSVEASGCLAGWVLREREPATVADISDDPRVAGDPLRRIGASSVLMVPVRRDSPLGVLGVWWRASSAPSDDDVRVLETLAHSAAVALEAVRVRSDLAESEGRFRDLVESLEDVVFTLDAEGCVRYISPSITKYGFAIADVVGENFAMFVHPPDLPELQASLLRALSGETEAAVFRVRDKLGRERTVRALSRAVFRSGSPVAVSGVITDITELKLAEEQLRMAQKMEAIGQLAGGVAHDFNNLLSVILSYASFLEDAVRTDAQAKADVEQIAKAATRAASLTRQLLAFSRKQVLEPRVLELNDLVSELEKMLRRLIGEDIELVQQLSPDLGRIKADPGQLEQVIMNLVVNARDAMPRGGRLSIATHNVELDEAAGEAFGLRAGHYVALTVSDTGVGMDEATRQRAFEPFFTTKELGKGTGLGLSTAYGIVTQSGGAVSLQSTPGQGTSFCIYLPQVVEAPSPHVRALSTQQGGGHETVLLVEDDAAVRALAARALRAAGYTVLPADSGPHALREASAHDGTIDLLLTDVVMPQMSGRQLADRMIERRPGICVLYMSGYTDNMIEQHGALVPGAHLITKPFSGEELASKVRAVLDAPRAPVLAVASEVA